VVLCNPVVGAMEVSVGPRTVNPVNRSLVVPMGVTTLTTRAPVKAVAVMAQLAFTVVLLVETTVQVTPVPEIVIEVAPIRLVPVRVTGTVVPRRPDVGETVANVGPCTLNVVVAEPPGVVTVTVRVETVAPEVMVSEVVRIVPVGSTVTLPTVTPVPETATVVPVAVKLAPVIVTGTVVFRTPVLGTIVDTVGAAGTTTVNVTALVTPAGVVTVTFLAVSPAVAVMEKVAVTVVLFTALKLPTVMPAPETVIAVAPVSPVPLMVTGTLVPRAPVAGVIEVSTGPVTV